MPERALDSTRERLVNDYGVELLSPCYNQYYPKLGRGDQAFDIYKRICPAYVEDFSEIHKTEPYVYSQTIAGRESSSLGETKNSWLTGTAAWSFVNISQAILGIKPDYEGLRIEPCLPKEIKSYRIQRRFRSCNYSIDVSNQGLGYIEVTVNGKTLDDNLIPLQDKSFCQVKVRI